MRHQANVFVEGRGAVLLNLGHPEVGWRRRSRSRSNDRGVVVEVAEEEVGVVAPVVVVAWVVVATAEEANERHLVSLLLFVAGVERSRARPLYYLCLWGPLRSQLDRQDLTKRQRRQHAQLNRATQKPS
jgi:hypothetical protein